MCYIYILCSSPIGANLDDGGTSRATWVNEVSCASHLPQPTPQLGWSGGAVHLRVAVALCSQLLLCRT